MRNKQKDAMFNYFINGLDKKMQQTLAAMYFNSCRQDEFIHMREMQEMENRITENVMKRITVEIDTIAIRELEEMLNRIGK